MPIDNNNNNNNLTGKTQTVKALCNLFLHLYNR